MHERLLQFLWQMQYYNKADLQTTDGCRLQILTPGQHNTNQGPDFLNASILIGETTWVGNIEIHVSASDWRSHQHDADAHYQNVILHVVWEHDYAVYYSTGQAIPVLELKTRVSKLLLTHYEVLMNAAGQIPCSGSIHQVPDLIWTAWKERLVVEKLEHKTNSITIHLSESRYNWQTVFWWLLARNFGLALNKECFEAIARSIPITVLARHKMQIHQLECMLLGQGGLLNRHFSDPYPLMLQKEYRFLKAKYQLAEVHIPLKFHRMRPANFPTIRLAQLAKLVHQSSNLFSRFIYTETLDELSALLQVTANDYWHYHYVLEDESSFKEKTLGQEMINNICINTVIPLVFAYGHLEGKQAFKNRALNWLQQMKPEQNKMEKTWKSLGISCFSAFDSQALGELATAYCFHKKCLSCSIGTALLKQYF